MLFTLSVFPLVQCAHSSPLRFPSAPCKYCHIPVTQLWSCFFMLEPFLFQCPVQQFRRILCQMYGFIDPLSIPLFSSEVPHTLPEPPSTPQTVHL